MNPKKRNSTNELLPQIGSKTSQLVPEEILLQDIDEIRKESHG
jgi:hypothetical protein